MDISREEQRVLHALAQGGAIHATKSTNGKVVAVECLNRDGWLMNQCNLKLFRKLKSKGAIASAEGRPYRITRRGLELVRSELDNR
ncbi:MAG: YjhX family toxin [Devosia sp.]